MTAFPQGPIALVFSAALLAASCLGTVWADEIPRAQERDAGAARLVDEVLRKAGGNGEDTLGDWTRSIVDRALQRAGETARQTVPGSSGKTAAPLPAERHAGAVTGGRQPTAEILVFTSLSVPVASWRQWAAEAAQAGVPLVLRGVAAEGMRATVKAVGERIGQERVGIAIDPRLFRLFGVTRVPAMVVAPGGVPPCTNRGCSGDTPPPFDLVTGNIGLAAALQTISEEGSAGRDVARRYLERLRGEGQP